MHLWDIRRSDKSQQQFTAHSGPVFACDWHPDMTWLATASRDKTIKVRLFEPGTKLIDELFRFGTYPANQPWNIRYTL